MFKLGLSIVAISLLTSIAALRPLSRVKQRVDFSGRPLNFNSLPTTNCATTILNNFKMSTITSHSKLFTSRCDDYSDLVKKPRWGGWFGVIVRYLNQVMVGTIFGFIFRVLNKFKSVRLKILMDYIWSRPKSKGLLTVCNHQSVMDDPGLIAAFVPFLILPPHKFRWTICTEEVFFGNKIIQKILGAGNGLPLDRSGSLEQAMFQRFQEKLDQGSWCHIFPEGRVWQVIILTTCCFIIE